jgi:hypothetical protein
MVIFFSFCDNGYAINIAYCILSHINLEKKTKGKFLSRCKGVSDAGRV